MLLLTVAGSSEIGLRGIVATMREIEVIRDPDAEEVEWNVWDHGCDGDGGMAIAIFARPFAEARARRFAERLRSNTD
jgi:hypothetical protein